MNHRFGAPSTDEVDELLRRFFRAEMPGEWPAAPVVEVAPRPRVLPRRTVVRFFRAPARLAVAAAVALLVIGYLSLQAWFPEPQPPSGEVTKDPFATQGNGVKHHSPADRIQGPAPKPQAPAAAKPPQVVPSFPPIPLEVFPNNSKK